MANNPKKMWRTPNYFICLQLSMNCCLICSESNQNPTINQLIK